MGSTDVVVVEERTFAVDGDVAGGRLLRRVWIDSTDHFRKQTSQDQRLVSPELMERASYEATHSDQRISGYYLLLKLLCFHH